MRIKRVMLNAWLALVSCIASVSLMVLAPATVRANPSDHPRLIVLTDIGNEPDDQMSMVRLMLYSNSISIEGLVAVTSTWKKGTVSPEMILSVIDSYARVRGNLLLHESGWPAAAALREVVASGRPVYGMAGLGGGEPSSGARILVKAALREDPRPLWVSIWGGASTLAEALQYARDTLPADKLELLISKLRVYSISDQDDAGPWIRKAFPDLFYIVKPSPENAEEYASATWTGISGDLFYRNCEGADGTTVSQEWLQSNIRAKGPLGAHYPKHLFIMEGDTPSYLGLIDNGLASDQSPSWGGWGGRYVYRKPYGESHPIWSQGGDLFARVTSADSVIGIDGLVHSTDQASIWRWRTAFQHDFAARMDWTVRDRAHANHPPRVLVNGMEGSKPIELHARVGDILELDGSGTTDPDNDALDFEWFHYAEAGGSANESLGAVIIGAEHSAKTSVHIDSVCRNNWLGPARCGTAGVAHIILAVTDHGTPSLTRYRRVIVHIQGPAAN